MDLMKVAQEAFKVEKNYPAFKSGDTVTVAYRIKEGNKERIQEFRGDVIRVSGHEENKRFTVRKMSGNIGVERIFPMNSPFIESITVNKYGKVRRAKLNCTTCVHLPVRKPKSKKDANNISQKKFAQRLSNFQVEWPLLFSPYISKKIAVFPSQINIPFFS